MMPGAPSWMLRLCHKWVRFREHRCCFCSYHLVAGHWSAPAASNKHVCRNVLMLQQKLAKLFEILQK